MNFAAETGRAETIPKEPRIHLDFLDGLRGFSALYVMVYHVSMVNLTLMEIGFPGSSEQKFCKLYDFIHFLLLNHGGYAVDAFIVLSGFCLTIPLARGPQPRPLNLGTFFKRRAKRIVPPYYAALLLTLAMILWVPGANSQDNLLWNIQLPALTPGSIASHFLLIHNLFPAWKGKINAPLWSVATEWQIYFVFALILVPVWLRTNLWAALGLAFLLGLAPVFIHFPNPTVEVLEPTMLIAFAFGMVAAVICFQDQPLWRSWRSKVPWSRLSTILGILIFCFLMMQRKRFLDSHLLKYFVLEYNGLDYLVDIVVSIWVSMLIINCTQNLAARQKNPDIPEVLTLKLFSQKWLVRIGTFSYSLYLLHSPVLYLVSLFILKYVHSLALMGIGMVVVSFIATTAAGYLFFLAVERHCLNVPSKSPISNK